MAVLVVHLGEAVEVEHDQAQLGARSLRGGVGRLDRLVEEASIEEAGERVADRGLAHPRVQFRVVQGELRLGHQQVGDPQLELTERPIGAVTRHGEHGAGLAFEADREAEADVRAVAPGLDDALGGGDDLAGQALARCDGGADP